MPLSQRPALSLPVTSPGPDISRHKLKQLASWIRDDLDVLVARDGPDILRPDDVVTLHEAFVALRQATTITALDLRATGIHKAVKDIAGIATRWPGRLCDDCDKIIALWTSRFGSLDELHPFLYGRGGRLEGVASLAEYSRDVQALLKRWSQTCPDRIDPKVSHKHGDLGFRAGDWWISPLFAHHAGIIGLESVEGGSTYDKDGAYALFLKDVNEIEARDEDTFAYRFSPNDKGRFRLTAATAKSREPVRVLRSHRVNSIWSPKAGIRYEGLYAVKGWCIRQASLNDSLFGGWKEGSILYEVSFQRNDPVPMIEVIKRPTIMEVDDYAEYKRLRKLRSDDKRKGPGMLPTMPERSLVLPLPQMPVIPTAAPQSLLRISPSISRTTTFKELSFNAPKAFQGPDNLLSTEVLSPMAIPDRQDSFFVPRELTSPMKPVRGGTNSTASSSNRASVASTLPDETARDSRPSVTRSMKEDLKEVIPWIELEDEPLVGTPAHDLAAKDQQNANKLSNTLEARAAELNPIKGVRRQAWDTKWPPSSLESQTQETAEEDTTTNALNLRLYPARPIRRLSGDKNVRVFGKRPGFLDGAGNGAESSTDNEDNVTYTYSRARHLRSSSADCEPNLPPPIPNSPPKPHSVYEYGIEDIEFASPFDNLVSHPRKASPVNSLMSSSILGLPGDQLAGESVVVGKLKQWLSK